MRLLDRPASRAGRCPRRPRLPIPPRPWRPAGRTAAPPGSRAPTPRRPRPQRGRSTAGRRRASPRSARGGRSRARRTSGRRSQKARGCVSRTRPRRARVARRRRRRVCGNGICHREYRRSGVSPGARRSGPELDAPVRDQIRLDVGSSLTKPSIDSGPTPRNTIAAPVGGSPSGPAITMCPASRCDCIVREVRVAVRGASLEHVVDVVVEQHVGAIFVCHRPKASGRGAAAIRCTAWQICRSAAATPRGGPARRAPTGWSWQAERPGWSAWSRSCWRSPACGRDDPGDRDHRRRDLLRAVPAHGRRRLAGSTAPPATALLEAES